MARFTSLEFMEALGLGYFDYNGAKILLRCLASKGIAKEVGKIRPSGGKGRSLVVYEIPDEITLKVTAFRILAKAVTPPETMPCHPPRKRKKSETTTVQEIVQQAVDSAEEKVTVREIVQQASESVESSGGYEWDDGWDDD